LRYPFELFELFSYSTLDAGLLARSQHSEGPATGHLDTGFSWFPCVYKQMLRWFPTFQVATTRISLDAALLARSQYSEGPATGHLDTGIFGFPVSISKF